jgi:hypothetical protein
MATELKQSSLVSVTSSALQHGMEDGVSWYCYGDEPCRPVTEEDVIDCFQGTIVALALEGRLRDNAGFLIGWTIAQDLPHPASPERRVL